MPQKKHVALHQEVTAAVRRLAEEGKLGRKGAISDALAAYAGRGASKATLHRWAAAAAEGVGQPFQDDLLREDAAAGDQPKAEAPNAGPLVPKVYEREGAIYADSRDVAAFFGKRHDHVLRDLDELRGHPPKLGDVTDQALSAWFREKRVQHPTVPNRMDRVVEMTKDGLALLAMGFTGEKALAFKVAYIEQFNRMEATLRSAAGLDLAHLTPAARTVIFGGMKRVAAKVMREAIGELRQELGSGLAAARIDLGQRIERVEELCNPHPATHVGALGVLEGAKVPQRGRGGLVRSVSARLTTWCLTNNQAQHVTHDNRGTRIFHRDAAAAWWRAEGATLIRQHMDRLAGQKVIPFPKGRKGAA